jgi:hypothetical protein
MMTAPQMIGRVGRCDAEAGSAGAAHMAAVPCPAARRGKQVVPPTEFESVPPA